MMDTVLGQLMLYGFSFDQMADLYVK